MTRAKELALACKMRGSNRYASDNDCPVCLLGEGEACDAYHAAADARLASLRAAPRSKPEPGIKAIAYEIASFLGVTPWAVNNGGVEAWERYRPLAERIRAIQESHDAE